MQSVQMSEEELKRVPKSAKGEQDISEYLNHMGHLNQSFPGVQKDVKRTNEVSEGMGPEGERGEKNERKRVGGRGPKAHSKNSDFGTPI